MNTGLPVSALLDDIHATNPTILGSINEYAFKMVYGVQVETPEGCMYKDEVRVYNLGELNVNFGFDVTDICTFDSVSSITYPYPIDLTKYFDVKYYIKGNYGQEDYNTLFNDLPEEEMEFEFLNYSTSSSIFQLRPISINRLPRIKQEIIIKIIIKNDLNNEDVEIIGSGCTGKEFRFLREADSPYYGNIYCYVPSALHPNDSQPENQVVHPYFGDGTQDGNEHVFTNVYEVWFKVFDRWGGLAHWAHVKAENNQPLGETELHSIAWDGTIDGQQANSGFYTFVIDYQNCSISPAGCFDVSNEEPPTNQVAVIAPTISTACSNCPSVPYLPLQTMASGVEMKFDHLFECVSEKECGWLINVGGPFNFIKFWKTCIAPGCNPPPNTNCFIFHSGGVNLLY